MFDDLVLHNEMQLVGSYSRFWNQHISRQLLLTEKQPHRSQLGTVSSE